MADTFTHEQKVKARYELNKAVSRRDLPRANDLPCTDCGHRHSDDGRRHEYDHFKGYAPENWFDVQVVCVLCHKQRDSPKVAQTHCIRGHPFDEANTYRPRTGGRACRTCMRMHERNRGPRGTDHWKRVNDGRREKLAAYRKGKKNG